MVVTNENESIEIDKQSHEFIEATLCHVSFAVDCVMRYDLNLTQVIRLFSVSPFSQVTIPCVLLGRCCPLPILVPKT